MTELLEIVLQCHKICHSVKIIFGIKVKSSYFMVYVEKRIFPPLCFPFMYLFLGTVFFLLPPKSIDWFNFQNTMSSFLSPNVHFLDRVDGRTWREGNLTQARGDFFSILGKFQF